MNTNHHRTLTIIVTLGVIQGLMLLLSHQLIKHDILSSDLVWLLPWLAVAVGVPTALQLVITDGRDHRVWIFGLVLAGVLAFTGVYTGWSAYPGDASSKDTVVVPYVLTMFCGWYVLLAFIQAYFKTSRILPPYPDLFDFAWNNIIILIIAQVFTGIFWGLLVLWAALFKVIGITFFDHIFYNAYFAYPVLATVFAFAIYVGRTQVHAVVTVRRIILAIFKGLLPLLAIIIVLFLAALPFMGLKPLWATGTATSLMLTLQIFLAIFLNAVYQDGRNAAPYPAWLRAAVRVALIVLPIYTLLCAYALYLRIDQHGWSTDRFWAAVLTIVVGLHVFGYAAAALRRSSIWMSGIAPVNISIAAVVVMLAVLVNSPAIDARRISAHSQVARLYAGDITAARFDFDYLRFQLGKAGKVALEQLGDAKDYPEADKIRTGAQTALAKTDRWGPLTGSVATEEELRSHLVLYPQGAIFDKNFLQYLLEHKEDSRIQRCVAVNHHCPVLALDLDNDRVAEYVVFSSSNEWDQGAIVYAQRQRKWQEMGHLRLPASARDVANAGDENNFLEQLEERLAKGDFAVVERPWRDVRIGTSKHQFNEH